MKPDVVAKGEAELKEREREQAAREARQREEGDEWNHFRTVVSQVHGFLPRFYKERYVANPDYRGQYGVPRVIEDPENPLPEVAWRSLSPGDRHGTSEFTCEGLTFRCHWKAERYGSDRADWDDGWWPTFVLVRVRRRRWPFRDQEIETPVHSPADVAEAVGG
ncbi:MAG: hypothetical protein ACJ79H_21710 [Myxococcales bacterium]